VRAEDGGLRNTARGNVLGSEVFVTFDTERNG